MNSNLYQQLIAQKQLEELMKEVKKALAIMLEKRSRERLANLRLVKPEFALQLELYLYQLFKQGNVKHLTDEQFVRILQELAGRKKRRTKIRIVR